MPTTTHGTAYTVTDFVAEGSADNSRLTVPDELDGEQGIPLLFYFHGAGGDHTELTANSNLKSIREAFLDAGFALLEANAGGANWGNDDSRTEYQQTFVDARSRISIGPVLCFGRSMGGITAMYAATQDSEIAGHVKGLILNSAVCDLRYQYDNNATHTSAIETAYGFSGSANFDASTAGHDPLNDYAMSDFAGLRVLIAVGDSDTDVPADSNGIPMHAAIGAHATSTDILVVAGATHSYPSTYETPDESVQLGQEAASPFVTNEAVPVPVADLVVNVGGDLRVVKQVIYRSGGVQRTVGRHRF